MITYKLDGNDFKTYGVGVSGSKGLTDLPKQKTPLKTEWNDRDGYNIDLSRRTYQAREITLDCWVSASGYSDFITKCNSFCALLMGNGLHYLQVGLTANSTTNRLHFMVYQDGGVAYNKSWNEYKMIGTFTLKLIEPEPNKEVVYLNDSNIATVVIFATRLCKYCIWDNTLNTATWTYNVINNGSTPTTIPNNTPADKIMLVYGNPADFSVTTTQPTNGE